QLDERQTPTPSHKGAGADCSKNKRPNTKVREQSSQSDKQTDQGRTKEDSLGDLHTVDSREQRRPEIPGRIQEPAGYKSRIAQAQIVCSRQFLRLEPDPRSSSYEHKQAQS